MASNLNCIECELLVKVSGNTLQLNSDLLENLRTRWKDDASVVVLSVLGQPKSRKTFLMNFVLNVFGETFPVPKRLFPYTSDEDDPRYSDFHGQEGVLAWKHPQCSQSGGDCTSWIFLDIWQEYPRIEVYKKLVDFCLSMSTTVIYSECCDVQNVEFWSPKMSTLSSGFNTDVMQLHFLIQTDDYPSGSLLKGPPSMIDSDLRIGDVTVDFFNKMNAITTTAELLHHRCGDCVTTSYIPLSEVKNSSHSDNLHGVKSRIISYISGAILPYCSFIKFKINQQVVRLPQVIGCFEKCVDVINNASCATSSHDQPTNQLKLDHLINLANQLRIPPNLESQELDHSIIEGEDSEMKELDEVSSSFMDADEPLAPNEATIGFTAVVRQENFDNLQSSCATYYKCAFRERFKNIQGHVYFEVSDLMKHHVSIIDEINAKISGSEHIPLEVIEYWFDEIWEQNSVLKANFNSLVEEINKAIGLCEHELCTKASNAEKFTLNENCFRKIIENVSKNVDKTWHKIVEDIVVSQRNVIVLTVSKIYKIVNTYNDNFEKQFQVNLCFSPQQFEDLQMNNLLAAKLSVEWKESPKNNLNKLLEIMIENRRKSLFERNVKIYADEEVISREAYEYALEKFKLHLDEKISSTMLSENELLKIYQHISTTVLNAFMNVVAHTEPWLSQRRELEIKFNSLQMTYVQKNKSHLKKIDLIKKEAIEIATQSYRDEMNRNIQEYKLSMETFNQVHASSFRKSFTKFHEKVATIDKKIWQHWEDQLKNKLYELEKRFANDNNNKKIQSRSYSEIVIVQKERLNFKEPLSVQSTVRTTTPEVSNPNQYGIGLYIDLQQVCVGVYVNHGVEFSSNVVRYEPLIGFADDQIFVGEELLSQRKQNASVIQKFNIFALLSFKYDNFRCDAYIYGKRYKLGLEEILTLYFHRIRNNTERMINTRISSCYVAVSGLLTCASKQLLKTSLQLAGFQTNNLIPCTTAMAISSSLKMRNGDFVYANRNNTIFVYTCSETVEVALTEISEENICVHKLSGDLNIYNRIDEGVSWLPFGDKLKTIVQRIFRYCAPPQSLQKFVLCNSNKIFDPKMNDLQGLILQQKDIHVPVTFFDMMKDILRVAAVLDANNKNHPEISLFRLPSYQVIHPYKLVLERNGKPQKFADFNNHNFRCQKFKLTSKDEHVTVEEMASDIKKTWQVAKYKFTMPKKCPGTEISFSLGVEGNLMVETAPETNITYSDVTKSMIIRTLNKIEPLLSVIDQKFASELPMDFHSKTPEQVHTHETSTSVPSNSQEIEDAKESLVILIAEVQQQLYKSTATTDAVKENIRAKVRKCESMINDPIVKVKQLQMEKSNLTRAAKLIKP